MYSALAGAPFRGDCRGCGGPLPRTKKGHISRTRRWCGQECIDRTLGGHAWWMAREVALKRAGGRSGWTCAHCGGCEGSPEVNHIGPLYGWGYGDGCHNHQDNLEVLCHGCHVRVTGQQREARNRGGQMALEAREVVAGSTPALATR